MEMKLQNETAPNMGKPAIDNRKPERETGYFSDFFSKLVNDLQKLTSPSNKTESIKSHQPADRQWGEKQHDQSSLSTSPTTLTTTSTTIYSTPITTPALPPPQPLPRRDCRVPLSRRFAHPCTCRQSFNHQKMTNNLNNNSSSSSSSTNSWMRIPQSFSSPIHLYDPATKNCLPTSRSSDMLLRDCHSHGINSFAVKPHHGFPCGYDDLICDARRSKCICKPPLHLYYETINLGNGRNQTTFGCVPIGPTSSPDGRINCRQGQVYNMVSRECQKIFDVNELPNYPSGVSATQFSFVTIVLIWILLLVLIVTAKLRKLRSSTMYRQSPASERRAHSRAAGSASLHHNRNPSTWLHPFIAAVNGHHHMNQHRRHSQPHDGAETFNDTDFFLSNGRRITDNMNADNNLSSSQQSLNNPPPKFEEIYSTTCVESEEQQTGVCAPTNEDLPTYDEAMKLQNTMPPDPGSNKE